MFLAHSLDIVVYAQTPDKLKRSRVTHTVDINKIYQIADRLGKARFIILTNEISTRQKSSLKSMIYLNCQWSKHK